MDYKNKYLKYKNKYLKLTKQYFGGSTNISSNLKKFIKLMYNSEPGKKLNAKQLKVYNILTDNEKEIYLNMTDKELKQIALLKSKPKTNKKKI